MIEEPSLPKPPRRSAPSLNDREYNDYDYEITGDGATLKHLSIDRLLSELEKARLLAMRLDKPGHAILATMGKAKLAGLIVERKEIGGPGEFKGLSNAELQAELKEIEGRLTEAQSSRMPLMIDAMKRVMR